MRNGKVAGGNSHQRAMAKAAKQPIGNRNQAAVSEVGLPGTARTANSEPPSIPVLLQIIRRIIGPGLMAAGLALRDMSYWLGITVVFIGFIVTIWELRTEPELIRRPRWIQISVLALCFLGFARLLVSLIKLEAPLKDYDYSSMNAQHPDQVTDLSIAHEPDR
jgi:uncharacterized membrane protein YhdT